MTLKLFRLALFGLLLFFSWLMLLITIQYIPLSTDVAFLRIKEEVNESLFYQSAFFTHVYTSMFALVAGFIQFSGYIRRRFIKLHRISGRVYVGVILLLSGPTGLIMGYYANGGIVSQVAFCALAYLWMFCTWKGIVSIRKGKITEHKKWFYRSYALTLSAISLRLWKWIIVLILHPKPMDTYVVVAWLGWVGNLLIAEWIIYNQFRRKKSEQVLPA